MKISLLIGISIVFLTTGFVIADDEEGLEVANVENDRKVEFRSDIQPIFRKNCLACHNESETEGELVLETVETLRKGGDSGPAVVPGNPQESLIFQLASHRAEPFMPPVDNDVGAKPMSAKELGLLRLWIQQGAEADAEVAEEEIQWKKVPESYAPIFAMEVSPDGRWLVAGRGNQLTMYSVVGKRMVQQLVDPSIAETHSESAHLDVVQSLAWSPDQRTLVTGGYRCIKVWQRELAPARPPADPSEEQRALLGTDLGEVSDFAVSSDQSRLIAVTNSDSGSVVKLVELPSRKVIRQITRDLFNKDGLSALDRTVALAKERLRVAQADVEVAKKRKDDDDKNAKKSAEDQKKAEAEVPKKQKELSEAEAKTKTKEEEIAAIEKMIEAHKERDKQIAEGLKSADDETKTKLTEEQKTLQETLKKNEEQLPAKKKELKTTRDEQKKKQQQLEDAEKAVKLAKEALARAERAVELRKSELAAAEQEAADLDAAVKKSEAFTAEEKKKAADAESKLTRVRLLDDGWRFGVHEDTGRMASFTLSSGELLTVDGRSASEHMLGEQWVLVKTIGYPEDASVFADRVTTLAFSNDGKLLASGGGEPSRSGEVQLWDTTNWTLIGSVPDAHSDVVYDLEFSPQGDLLASCGSDRMMKTIDPKTAKPVRNFEGHTGHVLGVSWRADGRTLATAGADKVVKVWDAKQGTQKKTVSGFKTEVTAIRFLGLEDRYVFSVGDGKVESRNSNGDGKPGFSGFSDYVHGVSSSLDGQVVAAAGQDRVIRVWDAQGKLIVEFK